MKLITKALEKKFEAHPYGSQDGLGGESIVLVRYFNPIGAGTWVIVEADHEDDDWCLWGYCELGMGYEFGPVMLSELEALSLPFGMGVERDLHLDANTKVSDLIQANQMM